MRSVCLKIGELNGASQWQQPQRPKRPGHRRDPSHAQTETPVLMIPETISKKYSEFGADEIDSLLKTFAEWYAMIRGGHLLDLSCW